MSFYNFQNSSKFNFYNDIYVKFIGNLKLIILVSRPEKLQLFLQINFRFKSYNELLIKYIFILNFVNSNF